MRGALAVLAALALAACAGGAPPVARMAQVPFEDGEVALVPPEGLCVSPRPAGRDGQATVAVVSCPGDPRSELMRGLSISSVADGLDEIEARARAEDGWPELGFSGGSEAVEVLSISREPEALFIRAVDAAPAGIPDMKMRIVRVFAPLDERLLLVTAASIGENGADIATLEAEARRMRAAVVEANQGPRAGG